MAKNKLAKFAEMELLPNVFQPKNMDILRADYHLKGRWREEVFRNDGPLVLEIGCGKGEYAVELGRMYPEKNFIGLDIKGARMWRGAKTATERGMGNVGFLRTRIELIGSFFAPGEVDEIWITFPDPQLRTKRARKRLTAPGFLAAYARMLAPGVTEYIRRKGLWSPANRMTALHTALDADPENTALLLERGQLHYRMNQWGAALNDFNAILRLNPGHEEARQFVEMVEEILAFRYKDIYNP